MHQLAFAWLATVLFAVSLGYFLYAYLFTFGVTAVSAAGAWRAALVNLALFTGFAAHHSLFARTRFKRIVNAAVSPALERAFYTLVASVLFLLVCMCWRHVPGALYAVPAPWRWAGYAVQAAGIWLTFAASRALDVLELSGVRQAAVATVQHGATPPTGQHGATPAAVQHGSTLGPGLITSGVYGIVRHPLYFGWTLFVFGTPDMTLTRLTFAIISTAYLALAIPLEERSLVETFGAEYDAYRRTVRWRMVPFVY